MIASMIILACAPSKAPEKKPLAEVVEEQNLLVSPSTISIGILTFRNILVTYNNPDEEPLMKNAIEPRIISCADKTGSQVSFITLTSKPRDVAAKQTEVYQLSISTQRDAKYGTYSCTMGIAVGGQLQSSPRTQFTVEIRQ